jgi:hypothetical protein
MRPTANELILTGQIFDHVARLRSFGIAAGVRGKNVNASSAPRTVR